MKAEIFVGAETRLHADLLRIWRRLLETTDLSLDDDFFDKGGDSLLATEMMLELERLIGKSIPETLLFEASTVRTLTDRLTQAQELQLEPVVKIGAVPTGEIPLLFFHGDWTTGGFYVQNLAKKLGPEQPLIAVAPHGMKGERIPSSLEDMAAQRLPQILGFQSRGPYRLGGHCVGGMVALETARLLVASGRDVQVVAMIDPIWTAAGQPWPTLESGAQVNGKETPTQDPFDPTPESWQQYEQVLARYVPAPLPVPILVFSCAYDGRLWHQVSSDFTLVELPGGHHDLVTVRSDVFAAHLRDQLKRIAGLQPRP